jgi:hypothetical protein
VFVPPSAWEHRRRPATILAKDRSRTWKLADYITGTNAAQPDGSVDRPLDGDASRRVGAEMQCMGVPRRFNKVLRHGIRSGGIGGVPRRFWRGTIGGVP